MTSINLCGLRVQIERCRYTLAAKNSFTDLKTVTTFTGLKQCKQFLHIVNTVQLDRCCLKIVCFLSLGFAQPLPKTSGCQNHVSKTCFWKLDVFSDVKKTVAFGAERQKAHHWKEQSFFVQLCKRSIDELAVSMIYDVKYAVTVLP